MHETTFLKPGIYRHYKGQDYEVLGVAHHSESEEALVVYRALYGDYGLWVRPLAMFTETVDVQGEPVSRFELIKTFT
ncbi:DUF1653 domain-containing protein [Phytohalomonas tamaricis]|uniref:DUF1653 domain-containing protein n=1 Tax=Phytohalomonas tamaricis TaxID=2081032 RepID=UPI000D0BCDD3|nr:DUF1653 domain-containing protein [Phytohalomonas tamaricis]